MSVAASPDANGALAAQGSGQSMNMRTELFPSHAWSMALAQRDRGAEAETTDPSPRGCVSAPNRLAESLRISRLNLVFKVILKVPLPRREATF